MFFVPLVVTDYLLDNTSSECLRYLGSVMLTSEKCIKETYFREAGKRQAMQQVKAFSPTFYHSRRPQGHVIHRRKEAKTDEAGVRSTWTAVPSVVVSYEGTTFSMHLPFCSPPSIHLSTKGYAQMFKSCCMFLH
jgi:hypothetical protein